MIQKISYKRAIAGLWQLRDGSCSPLKPKTVKKNTDKIQLAAARPVMAKKQRVVNSFTLLQNFQERRLYWDCLAFGIPPDIDVQGRLRRFIVRVLLRYRVTFPAILRRNRLSLTWRPRAIIVYLLVNSGSLSRDAVAELFGLDADVMVKAMRFGRFFLASAGRKWR